MLALKSPKLLNSFGGPVSLCYQTQTVQKKKKKLEPHLTDCKRFCIISIYIDFITSGTHLNKLRNTYSKTTLWLLSPFY